MIKIKYPKRKSLKIIKKFFVKKGLKQLVAESEGSKYFNTLKSQVTFRPDLLDLYRLYKFITLNKRTTVLEFGSGWSTLIFNVALSDLKNNNLIKNFKIRRNNLFELFVLDNEKKYLNLAKNRILNFYKKKKKIKNYFIYSQVKMTTYKKRFATEYSKIPMCNPDFIYLDGPGQFNVKNKIFGFNTAHPDLMPMSCDILKIEYFLTPGTIIVVDGRSANAKFLKDNFQRRWMYKNDKKNDQHIFLLKDPILGKLNQNQINFYNNYQPKI